MSRFLRENWVWIVAPVMVVAVALVAFLLVTEQDPSQQFIYRLNE